MASSLYYISKIESVAKVLQNNNMNTTDIVKSINEIIEQLNTIVIKPRTVTITFVDRVVTSDSPSLCDLFKTDKVTINMNSKVMIDCKMVVNSPEMVYAVLYELEDVCTEAGYKQLFDDAKKYVTSNYKNSCKFLNDVPLVDTLLSSTAIKLIDKMSKNTMSKKDVLNLEGLITVLYRDDPKKDVVLEELIRKRWISFLDQKFLDLIKP